MKNTNHPHFRVCLEHYWNAKGGEVVADQNRAEDIINALIKGGMSEDGAKEAVEFLWLGGYRNGYDEAAYDHNEGN